MGGEGGRSDHFPVHDASTKIVNNGIIWDFAVTKSENKDALCHDTWTVEEGPTITKVIRHHKFPRSRKFIPSEADSTPINPFLFLDKRATIMQSLGKKGERIEVRDEWKRRGKNLDKKRERWIGKTIFYVPTRSAKQSEVAGHHNPGHRLLILINRFLLLQKHLI